MKNKFQIRWQLVAFDVIILLFVNFLFLFLYGDNIEMPTDVRVKQFAASLISVMLSRVVFGIYRQIWRYGGIQCYLKLLVADGVAFVCMFSFEFFLDAERIAFASIIAVACINLLCALAMRMVYRYAYKYGNDVTVFGRLLKLVLLVFAGKGITCEKGIDNRKIPIAIIGAGRIGATLANDLLNNPASPYIPRCFVDKDENKAGREMFNIPVIEDSVKTFSYLRDLEINEAVLAVQNISAECKKALVDRYLSNGFKIKIYDYPTMQGTGGKRQLREIDIEELLCRKQIAMDTDKTSAYYKDKVILITGGGGSIGSELSRQLAKMSPKQIIILDIYENGAYDIQQELRILYKNELDIRTEIVSITNIKGMERIFEKYHPQIVINAAAHKHVPLMENNCVEAVENNVFGTTVLVGLCEKYETESFIMVSTDKAVNPTNVMGATKRMCEMIVLSAGARGNVKCSATRFGNVLGSAGSVIPLFKKQIASGGPITITDKRIIRYFMTIPEASQLVLQSGAMAKNGELFVLDMGQPIRIYDLAENMIRLSGATGVEIQEVGLRPGEKLYEELLVKNEELDKTENSLIFIERDTPLSADEIKEKLMLLRRACETGNDNLVRETLKKVVPTYKSPEEVNARAEEAEEMKIAGQGMTA